MVEVSAIDFGKDIGFNIRELIDVMIEIMEICEDTYTCSMSWMPIVTSQHAAYT